MQVEHKSIKAAGKSALCLSITGPSLNEARTQIRQAAATADLLEFRLDLFDFGQVEAIHHLLAATSLPVIFTLRKRQYGGGYSGDEEQRTDKILSLAELSPDYFDLEHDNDLSLFQKVQQVSPATELICSYHNFFETPKELVKLFSSMSKIPASIYKICCMANSSLDCMAIFRLLQIAQKENIPMAAMCMGEKGVPTRILGPCFGSLITYCSLDENLAAASGQLNSHCLRTRYRHQKLTSSTKLFSLIGNPVCFSPSHRTHNYAIELLNLDALFTKFFVAEHELVEFLEQAKKLHFSGFSVTMPHKEPVYLLAQKKSDQLNVIRAVNTIKFENKTVSAFNTDGKGAFDAIEKHVKVKGLTVVVLGAGGAAKAVAYEAKRRGAKVVVLNRTIQRAELLAEAIGAERFGLLEIFPQIAKEGYDVLINCTSVGMFDTKNRYPVDVQYLLPGKVVLDAIPTLQETLFLQRAKEIGCTVIVGYEMLMYQAVEQFYVWFGEERSREEILEAFKKAYEIELKRL